MGLPLEIGRVVLLSLKYRRSVQRWAKKNRLAVRFMEERSLFKGPFFGDCGDDATIYRIHVQDKAGAVRQGFLKIEAPGLLKTPKIDVRWDE